MIVAIKRAITGSPVNSKKARMLSGTGVDMLSVIVFPAINTTGKAIGRLDIKNEGSLAVSLFNQALSSSNDVSAVARSGIFCRLFSQNPI